MAFLSILCRIIFYKIKEMTTEFTPDSKFLLRAFSLNIFIILLIGLLQPLSAQTSQILKSTEDLSFLVGQWQIERTYRPQSEEPRILTGTLSCENAMDNQFIKCTYEMERPGKIRGLDEVYFNYNSIYECYESLWLSSTWPIKVLMQGQMEKNSNGFLLKTSAEFLIQNKVTEYVKGEMSISRENGEYASFFRKTFIRTSKDEEGVWIHHMNEKATRVK